MNFYANRTFAGFRIGRLKVELWYWPENWALDYTGSVGGFGGWLIDFGPLALWWRGP